MIKNKEDTDASLWGLSSREHDNYLGKDHSLEIDNIIQFTKTQHIQFTPSARHESMSSCQLSDDMHIWVLLLLEIIQVALADLV